MNTLFLEVMIDTANAADDGIESRDEIEDGLEAALSSTGLGEVSGGGGGMGVYIIDLDVDEQKFDEALGVIKTALRELGVPQSSRIKRRRPDNTVFSVYS